MTLRAAVAALALTLSVQAIAADSSESHPVMMWEVSGTSNRLFILGSIHLLREEDHPLPRVIDSAYAEAETLIMEIDMDDLDPIATQMEVNRLGLLQGEETLADVMGTENYAVAVRAAANIDIPLDMLAKTEPWLAAVTVETLALDRLGFNAMLGVEMVMTQRATADGKPIEGLETMSQQLGFLDGLSLDAQIAMLLATLEEGAALRTTMNDILDAWRYGDTKKLEKELQRMQEHDELNRVLIDNRNHRWVSQLLALLDEDDDYLIIVGALHLVGENGVPQQLAAKKIPIRQLTETVYLSE